MRKKIINSIFIIILILATGISSVSAQGKSTAVPKNAARDYIRKSVLIENNGHKLILYINIEIPGQYPKMQRLLAEKIFGYQATGIYDGMNRYIESMDSVFKYANTNLYDCNVLTIRGILGYRIDKRFITYEYSFVRTIKQPDKESEAVMPLERIGYLTYDEIEDKFLTIADVFTPETIKILQLEDVSTSTDVIIDLRDKKLRCCKMPNDYEHMIEAELTPRTLKIFSNEGIKKLIKSLNK